MDLTDVRIVMVRPHGPANVGMAARAIANHGLGGLVLVAPACFDPDQARWRAPGAHHVIDEARIVATVDEAVADAKLVVATTARRRRWPWPVWGPAELGAQIQDQPGPAAILFGPEPSGLENDDLKACRALLTLPTGDHSSLNLAQAITVTAHALRARWSEDHADPLPPRKHAPTALLSALSDDALAVLARSGYLRSRSPEQVRATVQTLLARLAPDHSEAGMLRGWAAHARWALEHPDDPRMAALRGEGEE
ncbi:MAG: tRNA (cytosine(32)/uridine(32)-2'-O)-methyltransferase TrmJ [Alphaproteobacteria bacterium]|nr:tRNA (cytosine(32)/uridine(32)-2'-O)-methyltransferase TrmJ [Alphaproteobacteria bacterium]